MGLHQVTLTLTLNLSLLNYKHDNIIIMLMGQSEGTVICDNNWWNTHSDSDVGRLLTNNETIELLKRLLFAFAFKTFGSQLRQGLGELLKCDYASWLCPEETHTHSVQTDISVVVLDFSSSTTMRLTSFQWNAMTM